MHMGICDTSRLVVPFAVRATAGLQPLEGRRESDPEAGDACEQNPHELKPATASGPGLFIQSARGQEEWEPCVTLSALPL